MSGGWAGLYTSIQGQESPNMGEIPSDDSSYGYSQARGWEEWCFRSACESSSGPHEWDRALKFYWVPEHCFVFKMVTPIPQLYPISVGKCRWNQNKRDSRGKEEGLPGKQEPRAALLSVALAPKSIHADPEPASPAATACVCVTLFPRCLATVH